MPTTPAVVLLADDDSQVHDAVRRFLLRELPELSLLSAPDGVEAEYALDTSTIDILLLDLSMPNMDGLTLLQRRSESASGLPYTIVFTAFADFRSLTSAIRYGARDFVDKLRWLTDLVPALSRALQHLSVGRQDADFRARLFQMCARVGHDIAGQGRRMQVDLALLELERVITGNVAASNALQALKLHIGPVFAIAADFQAFSSALLLAGRRESSDRVPLLPTLASVIPTVMQGAPTIKCSTDRVEPLDVKASSSLLQSLIAALLSNAKHGILATGSSGRIQVTTDTTTPGIAAVTIEDDGCGFPDAILADPFKYRGAEKSEWPDGLLGTGFGLCSCHEILTALGGTLTVSNRVETAGAVVTFTLPLWFDPNREPTPG